MDRIRFEEAIESRESLLLDGGLATEIEARGIDIGTDLWSAALLQSDPQAIVDAHLAFLRAGASCLISASYQASRSGFASLGIPAPAADELIAKATTLAIRARDEYLLEDTTRSENIFVAASIGPYGATLGDGSEYTGDYRVSSEFLEAFHEPRLELLDDGRADVLACETVPSMDEAGVLCDLLMSVESPAWVSFCCRDGGHLSDGTPVAQAARLFRDHPRVCAVGVNCTAPQHIVPLIEQIREAVPDKKIVVYPNSGETYEADDNTWSGSATPIACADMARTWRDAGATLIGGCCRMGPADISAMAGALRNVPV